MTTEIREGERWRTALYPVVIVKTVKPRTVIILTPDGLAEVPHATLRFGWRLQPKLDDRYKKVS